MIINGNNLEELKKFPDNYFHSVVLDPPYGIEFMGSKWDYDVPTVELWEEVLRVLKPGGYLLAFAGTRTQHRMAVNIEDAGFEIRDMIAWVYGSGFPKSHNIAKAIEKKEGLLEETTSTLFNNPNGKRDLTKRSDYGYIYNPSTDEAKKWEGWGTALKPALEPITMARKPFKGTVANNVLKNGVGGINIDGCRIKTEEEIGRDNRNIKNSPLAPKDGWNVNSMKGLDRRGKQQGRFPANFIHDGSNEVTDLFPQRGKSSGGQSGVKKSGLTYSSKWDEKENSTGCGFGDSGSASRFFYCAKASKQDRNKGLEKTARKEGFEYKRKADRKIADGKGGENPRNRTNTKKQNHHPTVKPTDLMRYLVRLVTPKNGIVLDCFMGSGSTGKACALEGFEFVGIDLDKDYCEIAKARIDKAIEYKKQIDSQLELF